MDLGETPATKKLSELLEEVTNAISDSGLNLPENFKLFRGEQRAIGEKMMAPMGSTTQVPLGHRCLGYAGFKRH